MNVKLIARYVGIALIFCAGFMFLSAVVSLFGGLDASLSPLVISGLITLVVGSFPIIFVRRSDAINVSEGFAITIFSWLLCCVFGMLPYVMYGGEFTLMNAWFESVSGFTTTGGTILNNVEALPRGLLFWRSSTHFIGGIGVVIFMLLVLPTMSTFRIKMSKMEISSLSRENYKYKTKETIKVISTIYLGITTVTFICLIIAGMSPFDAINHAFSIVSTGGFSTKNLSILSFHSFPIELVTMIFVLISGLHFGLLYSFVFNRSTKLFQSPITKFFLMMILVSSISMALNLKFAGISPTWGIALKDAFFQAISLGTTTGFATADSSIWPSFSVMILVTLSLIGACAGSTTGGLKADRIWIFLKSLKAQIKRQLHPNAVVPIRMGDHTIEPEVSSMVTLYISFYFFIVFIVALLLCACGLPFVDSFTSSVSSIGNVGPAFGNCGSMGNFNYFPTFAKFLLTIEMLLGRLEIYPLIMIFVLFKRK